MITTFDTSVSTPSNSTSSGGGNIILWLIGLGTVGYLGYRYVIKPELDKKNAERTQ